VALGEDDETEPALTVQGHIAGTLQYMSPEQLQGKEADARSDIVAFGCVLYEMLSGRRAFSGPTTASVIAAIIEREPEPLKTIPALHRVIGACLEKDPDRRIQNALDVRRDLIWAMETGATATTAAAPGKARLAYGSSELGGEEVFVTSYPGPGGKWISAEGGKFPAWSRTAHELLFLGFNDRIMAVDYTVQGNSFSAGKPRVWSPTQIRRSADPVCPGTLTCLRTASAWRSFPDPPGTSRRVRCMLRSCWISSMNCGGARLWAGNIIVGSQREMSCLLSGRRQFHALNVERNRGECVGLCVILAINI
jgi:hypothetical protein